MLLKTNFFSVQGKLIKLFSRQLVAKAKAPEELKNVPSLEQWLQVVGLSPQVVKVSSEVASSAATV